jgi:tetratricopeptide (TPR) repeat protein
LNLSQSYARAHAAAGDVTTYLESSIQNHRAALEIDDVAVQANAWGYLADANGMAGRLVESLRLADDGLARFSRDIPPEQWSIGASPHSWYLVWRANVLGWMGRIPEAIEACGRGRRLAEEDGTPEIVGYFLSFECETHYLAGDADRALACARQADEISQALGEHPVMVGHAQRAFAQAHLAAGRADDAVESARISLAYFGVSERQHKGTSATLLAEALLAIGDLPAALVAADEAIAFSRRSQRTIYEAMALGFRALARLRAEGGAVRDAAEADLAACAALIERTGARALLPMLCEWRAELAATLGDNTARERLLREARHGYLQIGAPIRAGRLAREVAS